MKIAILVDVHIEKIDAFNQAIEEILNSLGGRLIYRRESRMPLRIVPAENEKYPPTHVGSNSIAGPGVNHGAQGNGRWRMDDYDYPCNGPSGCPCRAVSDVPRQLDGLQEFDGEQLPGGRSRNDHAASDRGGNPPPVRLCVPSGLSWSGTLSESPWVSPEAFSQKDPGTPSYFPGA